MSNVNLILGELSKKKVEAITLPFSNKSVKVEKPTFKFQEDIIRIFEKVESEQGALVQYRDMINSFVSSACSNDINTIDKMYFLLTVLSKLNKVDYTEEKENLAALNVESTFSVDEDDVNFSFTIDAPTISVDSKFVKFGLRKKNLKLVEFAFTEMFRYVKRITLNNDEKLSTDIADSSVDELYKIYTSLPVSVTSKLLESITNNIVSKINTAQKDLNIEQDPTLFINL
jgi:hypothetical protein